MEVANGLLGTNIPQAILPGGTDNVMAHDLGISINLREAAELIINSSKRRAIDLVKTEERVFMLRAFTGLETEEEVSREEKDKYGQLAYLKASLQFMREIEEAHYKATVDGEFIEGEALTCFVLNAGSIGGVMGMEIPKVGDVSISDGFLDLFAITKGVKPLRAITKHIFQHEGSDAGVYHWRGKEITLESDPIQSVWIDGEFGGKTPMTFNVMPEALEMVIPA
jgi:diacylglycerol kinase family enzyme